MSFFVSNNISGPQPDYINHEKLNLFPFKTIDTSVNVKGLTDISPLVILGKTISPGGAILYVSINANGSVDEDFCVDVGLAHREANTPAEAVSKLMFRSILSNKDDTSVKGGKGDLPGRDINGGLLVIEHNIVPLPIDFTDEKPTPLYPVLKIIKGSVKGGIVNVKIVLFYP